MPAGIFSGQGIREVLRLQYESLQTAQPRRAGMVISYLQSAWWSSVCGRPCVPAQCDNG